MRCGIGWVCNRYEERMRRLPKKDRKKNKKSEKILTARRVLFYMFLTSTFCAVVAAAVVIYFGRDLPSFEELERIRPKLTTVVYSSDGVVLKRFAIQQRDPIPYEKLPPHLVDAAISVEDRKFWTHWGVHMKRIGGAAWVNLKAGRIVEGASTITQQLARDLFLTLDVSMSRKIKEALTAIRIERMYTKEEILRMYFNQYYFANGAWGIQSAAQRFYNKSAEDLALHECALFAAILKSSIVYSPIGHPDRALRRRNLVLDLMAKQRKISRQEAEATKQLPLGLNLKWEEPGRAPYFVEHVRRDLEQRYGAKGIYEEGLSVYTTLDSRLQNIAEEVLITRLEELQREVDALRRDTSDAPSMDSTAYLRTRVVQGALVALDPRTGHILAMVGGRDFHESPFNRATQALRQPGSAFKPFVYTAAIDNGWRPTDLILDTALPIKMPNGMIWEPDNYDHTFLGPMTLREGLKRSRNLVAIRLLVEELGEQRPIPYARRMGITTPLSPIPSLAIGTKEVKLLELVSAYGIFANLGIRAEPISILRIVGKEGEVLERREKGEEHEALSAATAAVMADMLQSVMEEEGTGQGARKWYGFRRPSGGKTGTTNNYADAWFVGFTPQIVAGVWVGFDEKISMGKEHRSGAAVALPVWARFMRRAHDALGLPVEDFTLPPGVIQCTVCDETYQLTTEYCPSKREEVFVKGTEPADLCPMHQGGGVNEESPEHGSQF